MGTKLTTKQEIFVREYVANGYNATKAALSAGYSKTSAHSSGQENTKKPEIRQKIDQLISERTEKMNITIDDKIKQLWMMIEKCQTGENLKGGHANPSGLATCMAELNKMAGHYAAEKTINANLNAEVDDTELMTELLNQYDKEA